MAEVKYRVCDKCERRLDTRGFFKSWKAAVIKVKLAYRTPDPYNYGDYDYELCDKCGQAVREFIKTPPAENGGTGNEA